MEEGGVRGVGLVEEVVVGGGVVEECIAGREGEGEGLSEDCGDGGSGGVVY